MKKIYSNIALFSGFTKFLNKIHKNKIPILMYHQCKNFTKGDLNENYVTPDNFEKQMKYVSENYNVISFDELKKGKPNSVIITFDDGSEDIYENAFPILKRYKLPATIFISTDNIFNKKPFWWNELYFAITRTVKKDIIIQNKIIDLSNKKIAFSKLKRFIKKSNNQSKLLEMIFIHLEIKFPKLKFNLLSKMQIGEMQKYNINIQNHGHTHRIMSTLSQKQLEEEIENSNKLFEKELEYLPSIFCYPNGTKKDFDSRLINILKEKNYKYALTTIFGLSDKYDNKYALKRIGISPEDDMKIFKTKISGAFSLF